MHPAGEGQLYNVYAVNINRGKAHGMASAAMQFTGGERGSNQEGDKMMKANKLFVLLAAGLMTFGVFACGPVSADDDDNGRGKHEENGRTSSSQSSVPQNGMYSKECASCHFLYHPGFLPERSWVAIVNGSNKHFGEDLALDDAAKKEVTSFLAANSAEKSNFAWSGKILKKLGSETPERITELPYIKREHRKIKDEVFKRPSIGSHSNCVACHPKADKGDYDEDAVVIPAK